MEEQTSRGDALTQTGATQKITVPPRESLGDLGRQGQLPITQQGLALELAIRIGDLLQSSGQSVNDTVVIIRRVCQAYGLRRVHVDITFTAIVASYYPGDGQGPVTAMRTVEPASPDLTKTANLNRLVTDIVAGESLKRALARFDEIRAAPLPYPSWVATLGNASIGMAIQLFYTTSPVVLVVALLTGIGLNRLLAFLERRSMPVFFQQLAGGWLIVTITAFISWVGNVDTTGIFHGLNPTLIAVGGIVQLVAGMKFVAAGQDAIDSFYVTATARMLQVAMLTAGIVAGLVSGLMVAARLGIFVYISPEPISHGAVPAQYVGAVLAAIFFAVGSFADRRAIALSGAGAALAWFGFNVTQAAISGVIFADFVAALLAAFVTTMLVRRTSIPGFAVVNGSLLVLVPGMRVYNGLLQMVGTYVVPAAPDQGASTLMVAIGVALAIASGASLGMYVGRPVGDRIMRVPLQWYGHMRQWRQR
ncbi:MAG: threonine/serine exporter family protein [Propionibacteriaceae bacterium]|nr:threonine/serine exporter family protein [Propionibacteriaceae bacterium]